MYQYEYMYVCMVMKNEVPFENCFIFAKKGNGLNDQIDLTLIANYNFALIYLALVLEQWTYDAEWRGHLQWNFMV